MCITQILVLLYMLYKARRLKGCKGYLLEHSMGSMSVMLARTLTERPIPKAVKAAMVIVVIMQYQSACFCM